MNNKKKKVYGKQAKRKKNAASPASPNLKYATGGFTWQNENTGNAISGLGGIAGGLLSEFGQTESPSESPNYGATVGGSLLSGAATGAKFGPIGAIGGAVVGAIGGVLKGNKQMKAFFDEQRRINDRNLNILEQSTNTNTAGAYGATSRFPFMEDGGNLPFESVQNFYQDYLQSPKYKERASKFYKYPDYISRQRQQAASNIKFDPYEPQMTSTGIPTGGTRFITDDQSVRYNVKSPSAYETTPEDIISHEFGHAFNAPTNRNPALKMTRAEEEFIFNRNKNVPDWLRKDVSGKLKNTPSAISSQFSDGSAWHDILPSETKSDIDALRYQLKQNKIYDTGTQDFNQEFLNKARKSKSLKSSATFKRLQENFRDKDLIDIMNTIAMDQQPNQEIQMAQRGGYIEDPMGYHRMPDGSLMSDAEMYASGGFYFHQTNQDYMSDPNSVVGAGYSGPDYGDGGLLSTPNIKRDVALQQAYQASLNKQLTKKQRAAQIAKGSPWSINDYKTYDLPEPGLESPPIDPIDLIGGGLGAKATIKGLKALKLAKSGVSGLGANPKVVAKYMQQFGKAAGYSTADMLDILGGIENNYSSDTYEDGGNVNPILGNDFLPTINIEQGEMLVDFNKRGGSGEIISKYYNDGEKFNGRNPMTGEKYQPHAKGKKAESQSNFTLVPEDGQFVISKKYAKNYDRAYNENDKITMGTIKLNIENDNLKKGDMQKAGKMKLGGYIPKYDNGGRIDNMSEMIGKGVATYQNPLDTPIMYLDNQVSTPNLGSTIKGKPFIPSERSKGDMLNKLGTLAPSLYNIGKGLFGSEQEQRFETPTSAYTKGVLENLPQDINFNPVIDRLMNERDAAIARIEDSTSSPSVARANIQNIYSNTNRAISDTMLQGQQLQNQIRAQRAGIYGGLAGQDIQTQLATEQANLGIDQINAQNRAAASDMIGAGLTGLSDYTQSQQLMKNQQKADVIRMGALRDIFSRYKLAPQTQQAIMNSDIDAAGLEALIKNGLFQFNKG